MSKNITIDTRVPAEARSQLMDLIREHIEREGLRQWEVAEKLGTSQPRISDLVNNQVEKFSIETLCQFANELGITVTLTVQEPL